MSLLKRSYGSEDGSMGTFFILNLKSTRIAFQGHDNTIQSYGKIRGVGKVMFYKV